MNSWLLILKNAVLLFKTSRVRYIPDSKVHGVNMGPTWVLSAPDGPHVGHMNLVIRDVTRHVHVLK